MKTLYVHVGTAKTGTTSIQYFMNDNRSTLEKHGVCYPPLLYKYPYRGSHINGAFLREPILYKNGKRNTKEEARQFEAGMEQIKEKFKEFDTVVISEEKIWSEINNTEKEIGYKIKEYAQRDGYQVKIIVYMRPQAEFYDSWWNQRVKSALSTTFNKDSFDDFIKTSIDAAHGDYFKGLEYFAGIFGEENIILKRFDKSQFKDGKLQSDFLSCMGLELTDDLKIKNSYANSNMRLSGNACEIKRQINYFSNLSIPQKKFIRTVFDRISPLSMTNYPATAFSQEEADAFMENFVEENKKIEEKYIHDGKPLFLHTYYAKDKWVKDNPYYIDDVVRYVACSDMRLFSMIETQKKELEEKLSNQQKQIDDLTKRIKKLENEQYSVKGHLRGFFKALKFNTVKYLKKWFKR